MKAFDINPNSFFRFGDARIDVNYWKYYYQENYDDFIGFNELFDILKPITPNFEDLDEEIEYCQIGNVDKNGKIHPITLYLKNIHDDEDEDNKIYKKVFDLDKKTGQDKCKDIMTVKPNDILISKTRPLLNKVVYICKNQYMDYSNYYYTKAFIRVRCKNDKVEPLLCFYILKEILNNNLVGISRIGKSGYPSIDSNDLSEIKIPIEKKLLEDKEINKIVKENYLEIMKLEDEIRKKQNIHEQTIDKKIQSLSSIKK